MRILRMRENIQNLASLLMWLLTAVVLPENPDAWHLIDTLHGQGMDRLDVTSITLLNLGNPIDSDWSVAGTGDFNEDGKADIVFQHRDGSLAAWYLDGTTTSSVTVFPSHPGDARWRVVGITDRNSDGHPDLLFQHSSEGTLAVWFMDGVRLSAARLLNPSNPGGTWRVVAP